VSSDTAHFPDTAGAAADLCGEPTDTVEFRHSTSSQQTATPRSVASISGGTDEWLLHRVQNGDKEALSSLFRRHSRTVRNVAFRILRDEGEADDLVQEVFLYLFRKPFACDPERGKAASWIVHLAYHRAFDRLRYLNARHFYTKEVLEATCAELVSLNKASLHRDESLEHVLGREVAAQLSAQLTPEQHETIQLFFSDGYTLREIAELTGRSLSNVRSFYYRGLERLRKYISTEKTRSK
jgi:RNA polymerase sigma-70 factor (ECF subfamily)